MINWGFLKGWRTLIFGVLITMLGSLQMAHLVPVVGEEWAGIVMAVIGVIIMILRTLTTTTVGHQTQDGEKT